MNKPKSSFRGHLITVVLIVAALVVPTLAVASNAYGATSITDNFARPNGPLGPNWTALSDGPLAISSQMVTGTIAGGSSGDIRTAETYESNQYSSVQVTATPLSGTQWIGPMVRVQGTGSGLYVGFYYWNSGSPDLMLFKRVNGTWSQLGSTYASGALAAGTQLTLTASASTLSFAENGVTVITATDTSLTGGAPGIMAAGTATAADWSGGNVDGSTPTPAPTYTIGGTVSGLSGTLVLQDNGGDNLNVTNNGTFTFPTSLLAGQAYSVTVATQPPGQHCTVSNGSGSVGSANVTNVGVTCVNSATGTSITDNFARPNGPLGPNWTALSDGPLAISSQMVTGTIAGGSSGDIRTAETYESNQYSSVQVTATPLSGTQWIGPMVRVQGTGSGLYVGFYYWNSGSPDLMLFKRVNGTWSQLGSTYASGALAAGTQLTLTASASTLSFAENGATVITATDTSLTGGAPGIMAAGTATAADWSGGNVDGSTPTPAPTYTIGGTVSGLSGTLVLQDNGGDNLNVTNNGTFTFPTSLLAGQAYSVTVATQPPGQHCTVSNGSGSVGSANVTNVGVTCVNSATGTSITDNFARPNGPLGPNWTALSDGPLAISSQMVTGTIAGGSSGDIRTAETYESNQYSSVQVTATPLSGTQWIGPMVRVQGTGSGLYVGFYYWNSGSPDLMLFKRVNGTWSQLGSTYASGALAAGTQLTLTASASTLSFAENGVTVITATDTSLTGGAPGIMAAGTATAADWSGGNVDGSTPTPAPTYTIGGTVSGLSGTLVLQDNGGDNLNVTNNGTFTFPTSLLAGQAYSVTVATQPPGQQCTVSNGSGSVGSANVTNVGVTCVTPTISIGGAVSGLSGTVVLQDNGSNLSVSSNGTFTFSTLLVSGATYNVTVVTNPTSQQCTVSNGSGTVGSADITNVIVTCTTIASAVSDNFARANGALGPNWTALSDGPLAISSQMVVGTIAGGTSGDIRTAETYASDQYSTVQVSSNPLSGTQWIGPMVRVQGTGSGLYVGIYAWNSGSPELQLFKRVNGSWTQLGSTYPSGALSAGTQLTLTVVGNTLAFAQNGVIRVSATDSSLTGGAPGIMANGTASATNWTGGSSGFQVDYVGTDSTGIQTYDMLSDNNGYGVQVLRVLPPTHPAPGVAHNFLFVLPVEAGLGNQFGDGLETLQAMDAEDQYNLTIVEPTFYIQPWFANNATDPNLQYETFMTNELAPWVDAHLSTTGKEQNWLIGFSKSGYGGEDLILKHPNVFALAASWDFPADMTTTTQYSSTPNYGTQANFAANYELTRAFLVAHDAQFLSSNRIWIEGGSLYPSDVSDYNSLLTSVGIVHTTGQTLSVAHRWDSGWMPAAVAALYQDSLNLPG